MKKLTLKALLRENEKTDKTFEKVSGIVYGPEIKESKKIWVDLQRFIKVFREAGESTLIDLEIEGEKEPFSVLIHDSQKYPVSGQYRHIDFYKVKKGKRIETSVELEFIGESPAVKGKGGILIKNLNSVEIKCLPKDLIGKIKVDLGELKELEDTIHIGDLKIPAEVELLGDLKTVIMAIAAPRTQEEIDQLNEKVEMDIDQVEGIKEKDDASSNENENENGDGKEKDSINEKKE